MTPSLNAHKIHKSALWRLRRLDDIYLSRNRAGERSRTLIIGAVVVELDNLFIQSTRLYVQCLIRQSVRTGILVLPGYSKAVTEAEFSSLVIEKLEPNKLKRLRKQGGPIQRRDEPTIRNPLQWGTFFQLLGMNTPIEYSHAIALNVQVYSEIGPVRNFYAHRSKDTLDQVAAKFPQLAIGLAKHPDEIVTTAAPGIAQAKYPQWSYEVKQFLATAAGL